MQTPRPTSPCGGQRAVSHTAAIDTSAAHGILPVCPYRPLRRRPGAGDGSSVCSRGACRPPRDETQASTSHANTPTDRCTVRRTGHVRPQHARRACGSGLSVLSAGEHGDALCTFSRRMRSCLAPPCTQCSPRAAGGVVLCCSMLQHVASCCSLRPVPRLLALNVLLAQPAVFVLHQRNLVPHDAILVLPPWHRHSALKVLGVLWD